MHIFDSEARARELADAAMARMAELDVPPSPHNFALWYAYVAGDNPELNHSIDAALEDSAEGSGERMEHIYQRFFGVDQTGEALRETSRKIQKAMAQVLSVIGQTGDETAHYGQALEDFSGQLAAAPDIAGLRGLVDGILAETRRMEVHSRHVESQLRTSSEEVAALKHNLETIRQEAMTDGLTGIANRKAFDTALLQAVEEAVDSGSGLCLLLLDIDHFKQFNDTWGHQLGDEVLKLVARTLVDSIKGRDLAARYGGEEFAVVLPHTRLGDAVTLAEQIRRALATRQVVKRSTGTVLGFITASIGGAAYRPNESISQLIRRADSALYAAKQGGRNRVVAHEGGNGGADQAKG